MTPEQTFSLVDACGEALFCLIGVGSACWLVVSAARAGAAMRPRTPVVLTLEQEQA